MGKVGLLYSKMAYVRVNLQGFQQPSSSDKSEGGNSLAAGNSIIPLVAFYYVHVGVFLIPVPHVYISTAVHIPVDKWRRNDEEITSGCEVHGASSKMVRKTAEGGGKI